jgi:hypothetical protein
LSIPLVSDFQPIKSALALDFKNIISIISTHQIRVLTAPTGNTSNILKIVIYQGDSE